MVAAVTMRARFAAQLLTAAVTNDPLAVVRRLLAVQAQDLRAALLALRARTAALSPADVGAAISTDRSLVVGWLNRGTLHLVQARDYWWLHALTTPQLAAGTRRRLAQEGVSAADAERGVDLMVAAVERDGPLARPELADRLRAAGVPVERQAIVHLLSLASQRGLLVRGPVVRGDHRFAIAADWVGPRPRVDPDAARRELAARYLRGHGPADEADLARWAGIPLRDARAALGGIADDLVEVDSGLVALRPGRTAATGPPDPPGEPGLPPPRLLGAFDPVLLGWTSREEVLGGHAARVVSGGVFRSFLLVRGRAAGLWNLADGAVRIAPFERLDAETESALAVDAAAVERFVAAGRAPAVLASGQQGHPGASPRGGRAAVPD